MTTDTAVEPEQAEVTEAPEAEATEAKAPEFKDAMQKMAFEQLVEFIKERNSLVGTANAANGDAVTLYEQLTEESTDPEIVAAREARDEAIMRLHDLVAPKVKEIKAEATEGLSGIEAKIKEIDSVLKPGLNYYKKLYGDEAGEHLPKQARLSGLRITSSGTGGRRVRGFRVAVTVDGEVEEFENFASAAKYLDKETATLQDAFFEAAGNPKQVKDAPDKVSFNVTFTEVDEDENVTERTASIYAFRPESEQGDDSE